MTDTLVAISSTPRRSMLAKMLKRLPRLRHAPRKARSIYRRVTKPTTMRLNGVHIPLTHTSAFLRRRLYAEQYECREYEIVRKYVTTTDKAVEIGAGMGYISVVLTQICGSENVVLYEANPFLSPVIRTTLTLNGVAPRLMSVAVRRHAQPVSLHICDDFWCSSTIQRPQANAVVSCAAVPFVDVIAEHQPTFVLMDIEGGEADLVGEPIDDCVRKLGIELHEQIVGRLVVQTIREWAEDSGFRIVADHGDRSMVYWER